MKNRTSRINPFLGQNRRLRRAAGHSFTTGLQAVLAAYRSTAVRLSAWFAPRPMLAAMSQVFQPEQRDSRRGVLGASFFEPMEARTMMTVQPIFGPDLVPPPIVTDPSADLSQTQRDAINDVVSKSTGEIWFQKNAGQFAPDVSYGFSTSFGSTLVYSDHLRVISNQRDPDTREIVGQQVIDIDFSGSNSEWTVSAGEASGVEGNYVQPDGSTIHTEISKEVTLHDVYDGIDLRLYSAANGVLEFDWILDRAQDFTQIQIHATGQDGIIFGSDGSATFDLRYQDMAIKIPETYQVIDGEKHVLLASMVPGESDGDIRYEISGDIIADQPLVIDPQVAWATYLDLSEPNFDSYLYAIMANSNGVYAMGWVEQTITNATYGASSAGKYMEVNAGFAEGSAANQNYIYRFSNDGLNITAWTNTGLTTGTALPTDLDFFPDGRILASFSSGLMQTYSANLATQHYSAEPVAMSALNAVAVVDNNSFYASGLVTSAFATGEIAAANVGPDSTFSGSSDAAIIRYPFSGATPVANWGTYIGGSSSENFATIAITPDKTKVVFSVHSNSTAGFPSLVNAVDSTQQSGSTELVVGVFTEGATKPTNFDVYSFLGGGSTEGTTGSKNHGTVVAAKNDGFWVGGDTSSTDLPGTTGTFQTSNGGGVDAFISYIPINGSLGTGFRTSYLGGSSSEIVGGIGYDSFRDRIFLFGTTTNNFPVTDTSPVASPYYDKDANGNLDIFISIFPGDLSTLEYSTYIGGSGNDYLGDTGLLRGQGHVYYSSDTDLVYLGTTVPRRFPPA